MRAAIYGAGSLGTILGAYITKNGGQIDLVNRNKAHVAALQQNGAKVIGTVEFTQPVTAYTPDQMSGTYDILFLMTKQQQNAEVVTFLKDYLAPDGVIVTLQNGLPELQISEIVGEDRVLGYAFCIFQQHVNDNLLTDIKTLYIDGRPVEVAASRVHKDMLIVLFRGVEDVNAAMALKNRVLHIRRSDAKLPKGSFFLADVIGARVVTEDGDEIGELVDIIENPTQNVYVVRGEREHLIPAVPEFIRSTDVDGGVVTVRLIEGM